jgi:DDE_Tnp_1-associated/Transposase DDE domain
MLPKLLDPRPYLADLRDPRRETRNKLHSLHDILMIVLCAVLSGVEDWVGMEAFAEEKEAWFRGFLDLPNGLPSHDTLSDVLGRLDPVAFRTAFGAWATAALPILADEQICLDGKTVRGSRDGAEGAIHLVSAFAGRARWVLAQQAVAEKANEITAIPEVLALLDLRGAVVSIDAMGCQKAIAHAIFDGGGDYVLALKNNHPTLCEDVRLWAVNAPGHPRQGSWTDRDPPRRLERPNRLVDAQGRVGRAPGSGAGRVHPPRWGSHHDRVSLFSVLVRRCRALRAGGPRPLGD